MKRHRPAAFGQLLYTRCGIPADRENIVCMKSKTVDCPECLRMQGVDRARSRAKFEELLKHMAESPRKPPLRKPVKKPVETLRFWSPAARRNTVRG